MSRRVLVIDDDPMIPAVVSEILESMGHTVESCADGESGLRRALETEFDLLLVDIVMPGMDGAEVTTRYLGTKPNGRVLVISGHPNAPQATAALNAGALGVVPKPFEIGMILDHLE